jgi:DNA-binding Lrp family transcriptional regulator
MLKKELLYKLYYDKRLSMWDIAKILSVTPATVIYWMEKHNLKRRSRSEGAYVKQNPNGDPFRIKKKINNKERMLLISGLMLYCGEGHRNNKYSIQLANLDHKILKIFTEFLRKICGVHKNKISLYVQLYRKFNKDAARDYWSKTLMIPKPQIYIYTHTDKRSKIEEQRSKFGIARIQVHNYKLKNWLDRKLDFYLDKLIK